MRKFFVLFIALGIVLSSCGDDEGSVTVVFQARYGDEPLTMFENVDYAFGQRVQLTRAEFFISNLRLYDQSGGSYELSEIEMIDMSFNDAVSAENGVSMTFRGVPAKTYQSMEFGIGVEQGLNATRPEDYASSHPLSESGRYWHAWNSFIFSKTEGNLDTLDNGVDMPDLGFAYHTGTDDMFVNVGTGFPLTVTDGVNTKITFRMNYKALFGVETAPIDIKAKPQNHNPLDTVQINVIRDNYSGALTFFID